MTFLSRRSLKLVVPQHSSHGKFGGLGRFCGTPKRRCPAISRHLSWVPCRGLQVQGGVLGTTSAQVMEGSIWQYPEYDRKPVLGLRKGTGVRLQTCTLTGVNAWRGSGCKRVYSVHTYPTWLSEVGCIGGPVYKWRVPSRDI